MEPLRGWGPSPWSPAPKADALSLAFYLFLLGSPRYSLAMPPCKEEEYPVGSQCCPKCSPGYRVKQACEELTGTLCVPCAPKTYTAHLNGLSECLPCRVCDTAMGLVTRRECSSTENTECGCDQGHVCVSEEGDDCVECRPHTTCRPGQRVRERGTERWDTVCEDCPPGTFSPNGTLGECQPWTKCSGPLEMEVKPGTSSTDVTCSSWGLHVFVGFVVFVLCGLLAFCLWRTIRRAPEGTARARFFSQWKRRGAEWEVTAAQAPQPMPDVTTVAVEETAPMFTERDQHADQQLRTEPSEQSQSESCQALKN